MRAGYKNAITKLDERQLLLLIDGNKELWRALNVLKVSLFIAEYRGSEMQPFLA
jgi:hypothetical protein